MIFFSGPAAVWLRLSEQEKKQLIGPAMAIQKQKKPLLEMSKRLNQLS